MHRKGADGFSTSQVLCVIIRSIWGTLDKFIPQVIWKLVLGVCYLFSTSRGVIGLG